MATPKEPLAGEDAVSESVLNCGAVARAEMACTTPAAPARPALERAVLPPLQSSPQRRPRRRPPRRSSPSPSTP